MDKTLNIQTGEIQEVELDRPILMNEEEGATHKLTELRRMRNFKLAETDWEITKHKELGTNIPTALKTYRQALRDITDSATSLDDVTWPEKP